MTSPKDIKEVFIHYSSGSQETDPPVSYLSVKLVADAPTEAPIWLNDIEALHKLRVEKGMRRNKILFGTVLFLLVLAILVAVIVSVLAFGKSAPFVCKPPTCHDSAKLVNSTQVNSTGYVANCGLECEVKSYL